MQIDWPNLLATAKDNKEFFGAAAGFVGVLITLIVNGILARRLEWTKYKREQIGAVSALRAELEYMSTTMTDYLAAVKKNPNRVYYWHRDGFPQTVYSSYAGKLGFLNPKESERVVRAYAEVRDTTIKLLLSGVVDPVEEDQVFYVIKPEMHREAAEIASSVLEKINTALDGLKRY